MTGTTTVTSFRLTAGKAEERIHEIAQCTSAVILTTHAKDRMKEREISIQEVYQVLRTGQVSDPPELQQPGDWKCKVTLKLKGRRAAGVAVVMVQNGKLVIKTVEWEDGR